MQKCELAVLYLFYHLSVVVDKDDQTNFSLPHFTTSVHEPLGHVITVNLG